MSLEAPHNDGILSNLYHWLHCPLDTSTRRSRIEAVRVLCHEEEHDMNIKSTTITLDQSACTDSELFLTLPSGENHTWTPNSTLKPLVVMFDLTTFNIGQLDTTDCSVMTDDYDHDGNGIANAASEEPVDPYEQRSGETDETDLPEVELPLHYFDRVSIPESSHMGDTRQPMVGSPWYMACLQELGLLKPFHRRVHELRGDVEESGQRGQVIKYLGMPSALRMELNHDHGNCDQEDKNEEGEKAGTYLGRDDGCGCITTFDHVCFEREERSRRKSL